MIGIRARFWVAIAALLCAGSMAHADVRLPAIISNNMVLQRDLALPFWGSADPGEEVTVTIGDNKGTAKADASGRWQVKLAAMPKAGGPYEVVIKGKNEIKLANVLVGEVWAGSGQSNMQWNVAQSKDAPAEIAAAKFPKIRLFMIPLVPFGTPAPDVAARWVECSRETVGGSSAVLFFFGRDIHQQLDMPVGLITTAWGGTRIQPWIPPEGYAAIPELEGEKTGYMQALTGYAQALKAYSEQIEKHVAAVKAGGEKLLAPSPPNHPLNNNYQWTGLYNGMIHPIAPFGIRGFLWYQGESNRGEGMHYYQCQRGLIEGWRKVWGQGDFPFLFVQLAPYKYGNNFTALPEIWEAQTATLAVKNTGMAVTTDITTLNDIHPPNKQDVGKRLALWALAKTYGKDQLVYSGPLYKGMKTDGSKIVIEFTHAAGLKSSDGKPLSWFAVAGADKKFIKAQATVQGETVVVSAPEVSSPAAVRFGWHELATPNLANGAGLPASPFRTDKWTDAVNNEP